MTETSHVLHYYFTSLPELFSEQLNITDFMEMIKITFLISKKHKVFAAGDFE